MPDTKPKPEAKNAVQLFMSDEEKSLIDRGAKLDFRSKRAFMLNAAIQMARALIKLHADRSQ